MYSVKKFVRRKKSFQSFVVLTVGKNPVGLSCVAGVCMPYLKWRVRCLIKLLHHCFLPLAQTLCRIPEHVARCLPWDSISREKVGTFRHVNSDKCDWAVGCVFRGALVFLEYNGEITPTFDDMKIPLCRTHCFITSFWNNGILRSSCRDREASISCMQHPANYENKRETAKQVDIVRLIVYS